LTKIRTKAIADWCVHGMLQKTHGVGWYLRLKKKVRFGKS
jgi:hypothetical protein